MQALPEEIRVLGWRPVPDTFNARFSTSYRQYKYFIVSTGHGAPLAAQQHAQQGLGAAATEVHACDFDVGTLNIAQMREAAQHFVGEHDFRCAWAVCLWCVWVVGCSRSSSTHWHA
jgi:tRNA pseudouridine38/39 synthase